MYINIPRSAAAAVKYEMRMNSAVRLASCMTDRKLLCNMSHFPTLAWPSICLILPLTAVVLPLRASEILSHLGYHASYSVYASKVFACKSALENSHSSH